MSKVIKLLFHVGYPKTATSMVRNNLATFSHILFIGKNDTDKKKKSSYFKGDLYDLHNTIFKTYRMEVIAGFANPSRSSAALLNEYADKIFHLIVASKKETVVISDECIGDYYNYIGEWNLFLIIALGNLIEKKLKTKDYKVKKNLSFTIRKQINVIKSFIGYSQTLNIRSVDQFLDCFSNSPYEGVMGSFYYYSNARLIESITDINWSIQIVPYEILEMDNQVDTFISRILNEETTQKREYIKERINSNSILIKNISNFKQILRPRNYFTTTGFRFRCEGINIFSKAKKRKLLATMCWGVSLFVIGRAYSLVGALQNKFLKLLRLNKEKYVFCSEKAEKKIQDTYLYDNKCLVRYVDENELKKFGYIS